VTFGGFGIGKHPACWVGTETGLADSEGLWIAGTEDLGDFKSGDSCPKACDTTLQNDDTWFFEADEGIRNLEDLKEVYHKTVGNNGLLEMDLAINRDGIVEPSHAKRYKELGDWIRSCYGEVSVEQNEVQSEEQSDELSASFLH
jgi:alpha-L-fucosidase